MHLVVLPREVQCVDHIAGDKKRRSKCDTCNLHTLTGVPPFVGENRNPSGPSVCCNMVRPFVSYRFSYLFLYGYESILLYTPNFWSKYFSSYRCIPLIWSHCQKYIYFILIFDGMVLFAYFICLFSTFLLANFKISNSIGI